MSSNKSAIAETVEHNKNFEKYKKYFEQSFWNVEMVRNVTEKGKLTAEEFEEITGEVFEVGE